MLLMARKENNEDVQKTRLFDIWKELGVSFETFYKAVAPAGVSQGGFRNYLYREPPEAIIRKAELFKSRMLSIGETLVSTGDGKLRVIGSVGAGGNPDSQRDDEQLNVPIEFARPDWRGLVVEENAVSMMPYIQPGDTIVIKPHHSPRLGKFTVIRDEANPSAMFVKKAAFDGEQFVYESLNPGSDHKKAEGFISLGYVVGLISADESLKIGPIEAGIDESFFARVFRSRLP